MHTYDSSVWIIIIVNMVINIFLKNYFSHKPVRCGSRYCIIQYKNIYKIIKKLNEFNHCQRNIRPKRTIHSNDK